MKYKVGDRVRIKSLDWYNKNKDEYGNIDINHDFTFYADRSKYCGKTFTIDVVFDNCYTVKEDNHEYYWADEMIECKVEEEMSLDKAGQITDFEYEGLEYTLPEGYIFKDENGNVINATKIILEKKRKEYPKTYGYCCDTLECCSYNVGFDRCETSYDDTLHNKLLALRKLIICRDAYWKIAGEEMGLGKPWEPDWEDEHQEKYIIGSWLGTIQGLEENFVSHPFAFPTPEMRDEFYENFKELINECKELL